MDKKDFQVVFNKLAALADEDAVPVTWEVVSEVSIEELDEIAELRRITEEITPPEMTCYTTT